MLLVQLLKKVTLLPSNFELIELKILSQLNKFSVLNKKLIKLTYIFKLNYLKIVTKPFLSWINKK